MAIYVNRLHTYVHIQVHTGKQACTHAISTLPLLRMCHLHRRHEKSAGASKRSGIICNAFPCFQAQLNRLDVHAFRSGKNDRMFFLIPWNSPDPRNSSIITTKNKTKSCMLTWSIWTYCPQLPPASFSRARLARPITLVCGQLGGPGWSGQCVWLYSKTLGGFEWVVHSIYYET